MMREKPVNYYEVPSESRPGVSYYVAEWPNSYFSCNCPHWTRSRDQRGKDFWHRDPCKHVHSVTANRRFYTVEQDRVPEPVREKLDDLDDAATKALIRAI